MEDIKIGHTELNEVMVIKTNDPEKLQRIFKDPILPQTLLNYENFKFELIQDTDTTQTSTSLQFTLDEALTNPVYLREIYHLIGVVSKQLNTINTT